MPLLPTCSALQLGNSLAYEVNSQAQSGTPEKVHSSGAADLCGGGLVSALDEGRVDFAGKLWTGLK